MQQAAAIIPVATNTVRASTFSSTFRTLYLDYLALQALFCPCLPLLLGWGKDNKLQKLFCLIAFVFLSRMVQCGRDGEDRCHLAFVWENHTGTLLREWFCIFIGEYPSFG